VTLIRGQPPGIPSFAVSGDGQWMLHSALRLTQLTNLKSGETFSLPAMATGNRFSLSDDGKMLASSLGTRVTYCSFDDLKKIREMRVANTVRDLAFSRDGSLLAVGANGTGAVANSFSPRSHVVPQTREDCVVEVLDIPSGQTVTCKGHQCSVESVVIADNRTVLSSGRDGLRRWDVRTGQQLGSFEHNMFPSQISADGKFVVGLDVKTLQYTQWDIDKAKVARRAKALAQLPTSLAIALSPDGRYLLLSGRSSLREMETSVIDMQTGQQLGVVENYAQHLALLSGGLAYYCDIRERQIMRWKLEIK
jgi:WD40 repeat protein